ncbi:hypothetical protein E2C01_047376 [Portunus trituberculatus]|uniref:Uncharacterized protein n=1 Tax=Portunus trituberculatus TaxID=210409 RepID=A0A5B7G3E4_PORTR|nr:hypothetical protein [Portunus trituberculatus]
MSGLAWQPLCTCDSAESTRKLKLTYPGTLTQLRRGELMCPDTSSALNLRESVLSGLPSGGGGSLFSGRGLSGTQSDL